MFGRVVRVRLERKATLISLLVVIGVRADGQKVLLAVKSMGGESAEAWRTVPKPAKRLPNATRRQARYTGQRHPLDGKR